MSPETSVRFWLSHLYGINLRWAEIKRFKNFWFDFTKLSIFIPEFFYEMDQAYKTVNNFSSQWIEKTRNIMTREIQPKIPSQNIAIK